jgi:DNA ligase 1
VACLAVQFDCGGTGQHLGEVSVLALQYQRGAVYLPELGLWLDAHDPQTGPERVFVSHAHSDHTGLHREVILSAPTAEFMRARIGDERLEHVLLFNERRLFESRKPYHCTLLPAGHIFGSAMAFVEAGDGSLLYTGDFKMRRGLSAEACEPCCADVLIMETTYGRPEYVFPPTDEVLQGIIRFCREALDNDETPVLLGYSLGKCQELLCGLAEASVPIMLHGSVYQLTKLYEQFGRQFPPYERYLAGTAAGKVLVCPPNVAGSAMLRNVGKTRSAVLTGWAIDPGCKYRYQADAAFPLSDHADFPDLVELVKRVNPRKVYTLHGFAADFAQHLRTIGFDAQALSEDEQFVMNLGEMMSRKRRTPPETTTAGKRLGEDASPYRVAGTPFAGFAATCSAIGGTPSKLEKVRLLADYLKTTPPEILATVTTWFTGAAFSSNQNKVLQLGWALLRDALCAVGGIDEEAFHRVYLKHSDLGETAFEVLGRAARVSAGVSVEAVAQCFEKLHTARGPTGKFPLLRDLLAQCSPAEARFLAKIITGDLRIGLKEGLVEEAIAQAFAAPAEAVRKANLLLGSPGATAAMAQARTLASASLTPFQPVKFMLASPEETAEDIWNRVKDWNASGGADGASAWMEDKYDGIRCQLHKVGSRVALYSRDLKDITSTFHEVEAAARTLASDMVLDGEIVAMRGDKVLPFSELQKRLGRREYDLFLREEVPITYVAFDALWRDGQSLLDLPLRKRRETLEAIQPLPAGFRLAHITPARSIEDVEATFAAARARGNEGVMAKDPESVYAPGRRGLAWLKLKKALATLDCVVVGAEFGHGKRNKVLSDYTFAVRDEATGELRIIGKAYSGLTDLEIQQLTERFLASAIRQKGRYFQVPPEVVLEIAFDRLQYSDRHSSGLAMRFPRIVRIRTDKTVKEIDTVQAARRLVDSPR